MKDIKNILNWYQEMGVNEITLEYAGSLIKEQIEIMPKKKKITKIKTVNKKKDPQEIVGYYWDGIKDTIIKKTRNILSI